MKFSVLKNIAMTLGQTYAKRHKLAKSFYFYEFQTPKYLKTKAKKSKQSQAVHCKSQEFKWPPLHPVSWRSPVPRPSDWLRQFWAKTLSVYIPEQSHPSYSSCLHHLWRWNWRCVPKRCHIKFRCGYHSKEIIQLYMTFKGKNCDKQQYYWTSNRF